jgi:putative ABC transport system permease protein
VEATSLDLVGVLNSSVLSGQFLTAATQNFPAVVLGNVAAGWLGIGRVQDPLRPLQLYVGGHWFTVAGVLGPMPLAPDLERSVFVGWGAATALLGFDGRPDTVFVKADERAINDVATVLPGTLYPQSPGQVAVTRPSDALAAKQVTEATFSALFLGLAGVALLVGGVGIANTMVISVLERRREIGLRRALGATRGQIRGQFLAEATLLSGLGGLLGTVIGVASTYGYATYQSWPVTIPAAAVFGGLGGAVVIGMLAGLYPSIRAARLTPTQALSTP